MKSQYCIDCGREINEYMSETLHVCNICETQKGHPIVLDIYYSNKRKG